EPTEAEVKEEDQEAPADDSEADTKASPAPPEDSPKDVYERTKELQLQAWQAQSDLDGLLDVMTSDELKSYKDGITARQQASEEGLEDRAVWDALLAAAGVK